MNNQDPQDPSKGSVGATSELDAVVIRKDGSKEVVRPTLLTRLLGWFQV